MFHYIDDNLYIEAVPATDLAMHFATPCFVYAKNNILSNYQAYVDAFPKPHRIFYAVKANSNLSILRLLNNLGSGFDCVSGGEISRVIQAGASPQQIIFSGVGKSEQELVSAITLGIHSINLESADELDRINSIAKMLDKTVRVAIRINPDIQVDTHSYITTGTKQDKFGVTLEQAKALSVKITLLDRIQLVGISCHIGSQINCTSPFVNALKCVLKFIKSNRLQPEFIDIGGGLGVTYQDETPPAVQEYAKSVLTTLGSSSAYLIVEPGRSIVANAGIILTRVEYIKNNFAIVDAGMNDLIRPALYDSYHDIIPVQKRAAPISSYNIVGPICESADFLGRDRSLAIQAGDLLAVKSCGAYCASASSNYNSRPRPAEVMVDGSQYQLIRKRETIEQLWENEKCDAS